MTVTCDKDFSLGLFAIEEGSKWRIIEIRYTGENANKAVIRLKEIVDHPFVEPIYIEITQKDLAMNFSLCEEENPINKAL